MKQREARDYKMTNPVWLRLSPEQVKELDAIAASQNRTRAAQIKEIVEQYLRSFTQNGNGNQKNALGKQSGK